jgi:hypothetical protein
MVVFELRTLNAETVQVFSWVNGRKRDTYTCEGEFSTMPELVNALERRRAVQIASEMKGGN